MKEYLIHHKNLLNLAYEIKRAVDDYWNRELTETELRELLWKFAATGKLFKAKDYNKTIKKINGHARMEVIDKMLEGYQQRI
ncbi:MAG: TIGR04540 family protein [Thermotaleaceae bacterium]